MPYFISHIVYLQKFWTEMEYDDKCLLDGVLGNILPDVQYVLKQEKSKTHFSKPSDRELTYGELYSSLLERVGQAVKVPNLAEERADAFKKGIAFHIALDHWWPKQVHFPSDFPRFGMCLKFVEEVARWSMFQQMSENTYSLPYEIEFLDIPQTAIKQWYRFIFQYLKMKPTPAWIEMMLVRTNLCDAETAKLIAGEVEKTLLRPEVTDKLNELFTHFSWDQIAQRHITEKTS